jgi:2-(1,2-epoxy-1,2-dihydrophenyl)acetyl-CoA isomerase
MEERESLTLERDGAVATLRLNRPDSLNGITNRMMRELHETLKTFDTDTETRVLILTGTGRGFCPGADLHHYTEGREDDPLLDAYFEVPALLHELPQVTIAAINGACAGAGFGFACACDLRYAAESAKFNTAFLGVGASGDMAVPWFLSRIVGATRARELCFLPRKLTAQEAKELGVVLDVLPNDALLDHVRDQARTLTTHSSVALTGMKRNFVTAERTGLRDYLEIETARHRASTSSQESKDAFRAFTEKG